MTTHGGRRQTGTNGDYPLKMEDSIPPTRWKKPRCLGFAGGAGGGGGSTTWSRVIWREAESVIGRLRASAIGGGAARAAVVLRSAARARRSFAVKTIGASTLTCTSPGRGFGNGAVSGPEERVVAFVPELAGFGAEAGASAGSAGGPGVAAEATGVLPLTGGVSVPPRRA